MSVQKRTNWRRVGINFKDIELKSACFAEWKRYGQSKLGSIYLTKELVRRYSDKGIISLAVHPGVIKTQLHDQTAKSWSVTIAFKAPTKKISEDEGAYTQIFAATHPRIITDNLNGAYLVPMAKKGSCSKDAKNPKYAEKLWDYLERELATKM
eukprot:Phypoly_transcript_18959.p1 GENE.Phypoly_transcript_18959~~Phypoly_transcript_18959.p1  ORF type:complete len:153 (+),score=22.91 Phypoly_transcript_18959:266-724(+)